MKTIRISDLSFRTLASAAEFAFKPKGRQLDDGSWLVPIEDEVLERLQQATFPGETIDDTIQRLVNFYHKRRPN